MQEMWIKIPQHSLQQIHWFNMLPSKDPGMTYVWRCCYFYVVLCFQKMAIFAIPETKPSACRLTCPSLYTIIQCLCTLTICSVLMTCMTSTLWVENFVVSESSAPYRLLSVGLFKVCYYTDIERPGTATDCTDVKFKGNNNKNNPFCGSVA